MATRLRSPDARSVVALLATRGRFDLLALRALPSILAQSRLPDRILVVVDQSPSELPDEALAEQARRLRALCRGRVRLTVMRNRRTPARASGAWNTGLDQLHRDIRQPDLVFVAVLDDDDAWEPDHLALCLDAAVGGDLNMVASGLIRHTTAEDAGHQHAIPSRLDPVELFVRGQHIQGSNLFVRLDLLLLGERPTERSGRGAAPESRRMPSYAGEVAVGPKRAAQLAGSSSSILFAGCVATLTSTSAK